ncbi:TetR family transcriptional regulator [Streptomyces sp. ML-6]|uniref:TetR/AcrR family transcriptional regulator n=1 Tax=Streptomyces sp. ML-6 TaxID=2982693 RepID=UPI0024C07475|nr:TetR family transcriptional regulator [Streptomyces sp. ML-6]MDK0523880.1 TetR family transcriptional regulator [Streptomyces sp. ML-6]
MTTPMREPRMARGAARREALLDAATRLLAREGARALTHRAIAAEAGTTHGIARYYFGTLDQLLDEALRRLATQQIEEVRVLFHQLPEVDIPQRITRIVQYVTGSLARDRDSGIARYEFFLEVARRRQLQDSLNEWGATQRAAFAAELRGAGSADPEAGAADLLTLINGLLLEQLALPIDDFEEVRLRPAVERFFPKG